MTPRLPRLARQLVAGLVGLLLVAGLGACADDPVQPAKPDSVALTTTLADTAVRIGLVLSLTAPPGEGAEWRDAAEGAQVAVRRFTMGGTTVALDVVNDNGSAQGATAAVKTLAGRKVSGIVMATSGRHIVPALGAATQAGVPILLPYADRLLGVSTGTWLTGPTREIADARVVAGLKERGARRPFLISAGGGPIEGLRPAGTALFESGADAAALATSLARRQQQPKQAVDAVVISGPAVVQAALVQALQGARVDVPYVMTADALSPAFPAALAKAGGSLASPLVSAGLNDGDAAALEPSPAGRALAAYFSALRMIATDPEARDLLGDRPFSEVAYAADVRSHDAVVALVRTAASIDSADPREIGRALANQTMDLGDGIAGTALDFASPTAVADDAVVTLESTAESPDVRPVVKESPPRLYWFPTPPP